MPLALTPPSPAAVARRLPLALLLLPPPPPPPLPLALSLIDANAGARFADAAATTTSPVPPPTTLAGYAIFATRSPRTDDSAPLLRRPATGRSRRTRFAGGGAANARSESVCSSGPLRNAAGEGGCAIFASSRRTATFTNRGWPTSRTSGCAAGYARRRCWLKLVLRTSRELAEVRRSSPADGGLLAALLLLRKTSTTTMAAVVEEREKSGARNDGCDEGVGGEGCNLGEAERTMAVVVGGDKRIVLADVIDDNDNNDANNRQQHRQRSSTRGAVVVMGAGRRHCFSGV